MVHEISKDFSSYTYHPISSKPYDIGYRDGKSITFVAIGQVLKMLWHFEILRWVNGKPKMWNISKTADRRAKRTKICDLVYYSAHM